MWRCVPGINHGLCKALQSYPLENVPTHFKLLPLVLDITTMGKRFLTDYPIYVTWFYTPLMGHTSASYTPGKTNQTQPTQSLPTSKLLNSKQQPGESTLHSHSSNIRYLISIIIFHDFPWRIRDYGFR